MKYSFMVGGGALLMKSGPDIKRIVLILIILIFFVVWNDASAQQKILSLRPSLGMEFPMNHVYERNVHKQFRYNNFSLYPEFGLSLQYELSDRLDIFGGWNNGSTGFSFTVFCPDKQCGAKFAWHQSTQRFPIGFHWELKDVWLFPVERRFRFFNKIANADERLLYLVLFRLKATFGLSYNYLSLSSNEDEPHFVKWPLGNDEITHLTQTHIANRHAVSAFGGVTLQFYNHKKDKVQLTLLYNQGILRQLISPLDYTINNQEYSAQLGSRGSYFAATLTYPIRLATFGSSKE
jgi:hypothetical protein